MKNLFRLLCVFLFVGVLSCEKNETPGTDGESPDKDLSLRYAVPEEGVSLNPSDFNEIFSFLKEGQNLPVLYPDFFDGKNFVQGVKVTGNPNEDAPVYVAVIGEKASYNNALGYYYYDGEGGINEGKQEEILQSIYSSGPDGITLTNPIVAAESPGGKFQIYRLYGDRPDGNFSSGMVIRFYLLPNGYGSPKTIKVNKFGAPYLLATDTEFNEKGIDIKGGNRKGFASHITGRSVNDDLVFSFEDLNSYYSGKSDDDFNDLIFIVTDNYSVDEYGNATLGTLDKSSRLSPAGPKFEDLPVLKK